MEWAACRRGAGVASPTPPRSVKGRLREWRRARTGSAPGHTGGRPTDGVKKSPQSLVRPHPPRAASHRSVSTPPFQKQGIDVGRAIAPANRRTPRCTVPSVRGPAPAGRPWPSPGPAPSAATRRRIGHHPCSGSVEGWGAAVVGSRYAWSSARASDGSASNRQGKRRSSPQRKL